LKCRTTTKQGQRSKVWTARTSTAAGLRSMKLAREPLGAEVAGAKVAIGEALEAVAVTVVTLDINQQQRDR
jgi:hypothetical protein